MEEDAYNKRKPEEVEILPAGWMRQGKKLKRMETAEAAQEEEFGIHEWWKWAEERCIRAGELKRRLETDRNRVLRMMESRSQDLILQDGPGWWRMAKGGQDGVKSLKLASG